MLIFSRESSYDKKYISHFPKSVSTCLKHLYFQDDLKATLTAKNREAKQLSQLEKTRQRNPSDRHIIVSCISSDYKILFFNFREMKHLEGI